MIFHISQAYYVVVPHAYIMFMNISHPAATAEKKKTVARRVDRHTKNYRLPMNGGFEDQFKAAVFLFVGGLGQLCPFLEHGDVKEDVAVFFYIRFSKQITGPLWEHNGPF